MASGIEMHDHSSPVSPSDWISLSSVRVAPFVSAVVVVVVVVEAPNGSVGYLVPLPKKPFLAECFVFVFLVDGVTGGFDSVFVSGLEFHSFVHLGQFAFLEGFPIFVGSGRPCFAVLCLLGMI